MDLPWLFAPPEFSVLQVYSDGCQQTRVLPHRLGWEMIPLGWVLAQKGEGASTQESADACRDAARTIALPSARIWSLASRHCLAERPPEGVHAWML